MPNQDRPLRVGIVSSVGGHLREVLELLPILRGCELFLVLNDEAAWLPADALPGVRRHRIVHAERDVRQLVNLAEAVAILGRERPDVLISTGASPAVPFFAVGRALSARTIFIEDFNLVDTPSLTGRLVYPLAHDFFVQWPQLLPAFPRARYEGALFSIGAGGAAVSVAADAGAVGDAGDAGEPLSLFCTLGTSPRPMRRLLAWLDDAVARGDISGRVLVQGSSDGYKPRHITVVPLLPEPDVVANLRRARRIVSHGGCGVLGTCMKLGRRPLAVPRRADADEAINDHQIMLCRALSDRGLAVLCQSEAELLQALRQPESSTAVLAQAGARDDLHAAIAAILIDVAGRRGCRRPDAVGAAGRAG